MNGNLIKNSICTVTYSIKIYNVFEFLLSEGQLNLYDIIKVIKGVDFKKIKYDFIVQSILYNDIVFHKINKTN